MIKPIAGRQDCRDVYSEYRSKDPEFAIAMLKVIETIDREFPETTLYACVFPHVLWLYEVDTDDDALPGYSVFWSADHHQFIVTAPFTKLILWGDCELHAMAKNVSEVILFLTLTGVLPSRGEATCS
jgi:hypothetical protein